MNRIYTITLLLCFLTATAFGQTIIKDGDLEGGNTYNWTKDNVYLLDGFVYLEDGGTLNIEAGTVIKGKEIPTTGDNASALIISRGAQINAVGTASEPIIFTAELDDTNDPSDLFESDRGFWGGLIILGRATITDEECEQGIEGIPVGETRALYGDGNCNFNDTESSGTLKYVSIRHAGAQLTTGNEINGLTLGAVGSGTTIEYIEVFANDDDGIEWFGGTVSVKWACVSFCGDDSYDYDTGWRGNGQFWLSLQGEDRADNGGEHDGAKPDDNTPPSDPKIYNATFIGSGEDNTNPDVKNEHALYFRDGTAGTYANSIFTDFTNFAIQVEDRGSGLDSRQRMENGEMLIANNIWFGFGEGSELNAGANGIIQATADAEDPTCQFLVDHLGSNGNTLEDPMLTGISRTTDGGFNPVPEMGSPAMTGTLAEYPSDNFFSPALFKGAFCGQGVWIKDWTAVSEYGILDNAVAAADNDCGLVTNVDDLFVQDKGYVLAQSQPNPASDIAEIGFSLPQTSLVNLYVYDQYGKIVTQLLNNERMVEGDHFVNLNVANLPNGVYYYSLRNDEITLTKSLVVIR